MLAHLLNLTDIVERNEWHRFSASCKMVVLAAAGLSTVGLATEFSPPSSAMVFAFVAALEKATPIR